MTVDYYIKKQEEELALNITVVLSLIHQKMMLIN